MLQSVPKEGVMLWLSEDGNLAAGDWPPPSIGCDGSSRIIAMHGNR